MTNKKTVNPYANGKAKSILTVLIKSIHHIVIILQHLITQIWMTKYMFAQVYTPFNGHT